MLYYYTAKRIFCKETIRVKNMKKLTKDIFLPPGSSERIVTLTDFGSSEYFGKNIFMSALCSHPAGYRAVHPAPGRHLVFLCRKGRYSYRSGDNTGVLQPGDIVLMPAGEEQFISSLEESQNIFFLLEPSPAWNFDKFFHTSSNSVELIWQLMEKALQLNNIADSGEIQKGSLGTLLFDILKEELHGDRKDIYLFQRLRSKLQSAPQKQWSVGEMADICGVSVPHFFVLCRRYYGVSPYAMLKKMRLEQARELLVSTGYPVKSIAALCGYEHPFAFSRSFRQMYGVSPASYRAKKISK